jgi:hypothetical protein
LQNLTRTTDRSGYHWPVLHGDTEAFPAEHDYSAQSGWFLKDRWNDFLYSSQFAAALGIRPFADVVERTDQSGIAVASIVDHTDPSSFQGNGLGLAILIKVFSHDDVVYHASQHGTA